MMMTFLLTGGSIISFADPVQVPMQIIKKDGLCNGSTLAPPRPWYITQEGLSAETVSWTLDVYSATTGEKEFSKEVTGSSYIIETTGWKPGIYVVKGLIGENVMSEKVVVR